MTNCARGSAPWLEPIESDLAEDHDDLSAFSILAEGSVESQLEKNRAWHRNSMTSLEGISCRNALSEPVRFNLLSMPQWLAVADVARVPFVPARMIADVATEVFEDFMNLAGEDDCEHPFSRFHDSIVSALKRDGSEVLRFEHIAPAEVKANRGSGAPLGCGIFWSDPLQQWLVPTFDERFYTTLLDFAPDKIRAYVRPVVETEDIPGKFNGKSGNWPVEFRVFVENMKVVGVSNYYPQIALDESYLSKAREAARLAREMIATMRRKRIGVGNARFAPDVGDQHRDCAITPKHWGPQDFTLDFILERTSRRLVFLEGGPAGIYGAHPCCFAGHRTAGSERHPLAGVVLSDGGHIHTLYPDEVMD